MGVRMDSKSCRSYLLALLLWAVMICPSFAANAYEDEIRTLERTLSKARGKEKKDCLRQLVDLYDNRSPKKARHFCVLLRDACRELGDARGEAAALYDLGNYYYYTGYYDKALEIYQQMTAHCRCAGLKVYLARSYVLTGRVYYKRGYYDDALVYYDKSLELRKAIDDKWGIYCSLNNIGHVYAQLGDYAKAVAYQFESLKGYDEIGDKFGIGFSFENVGKAYFALKNYDKALDFFLKSYEAYKQIDDSGFMGFALLNIGNCYRMVGDSKQAFNYYKQGMRLAEEKNLGWTACWAMAYESAVLNDIGEHEKAITLCKNAALRFREIDDRLGLFFVQQTLAQAYYETDRLEQAVDCMNSRLALAVENNDRITMAQSFNFLGAVHARQQSYGDALDMLKKGATLAKQVQSPDLISDNVRIASTLASAMGDYKQALERFKQYQSMENSKNSRLTKGKLLEQQREYEARQEALENKVRHLYLALGVTFGGLVVFLVFRGFRHYHHELARKNELNRTLQVESQLKLFQARINPHFLFNSLDAVIQIGRKKNTPGLTDTLLKLSNVYRNILAMPDLPEVALSRELELVSDYLSIEKEISGNRIDFEINLPDELAHCRIIPLCVLTLVENAVKHGLAGKNKSGSISIDVVAGENRTIIKVSDTGAGYDPKTMTEGFGLFSIRKRLDLHYKGKASFEITSQKGDSTVAMIGIPNVRD